jgi:hypothetical protein
MPSSKILSHVDFDDSDNSIDLNESNAISRSTSASASQPESQLNVHEWIAISIILGFLLLLTLIAAIGQSPDYKTLKTGPGSYLKPQEIEIHIAGAVANPGTYRVKAGTKLQEAIILADPLLEADLRKIKPARRLRNGQKIVLPTREMISISISGAVQEEVTLSVPKGLRLNELSKYIKFTEDADVEKIKSKRFLRNQEKINIPSKSAVNVPRKGSRKKM